MKKKKYSIRFAINLSFIILIIIIFSLIAYFGFFSWKSAKENILTKINNDTNKDILNNVENFINNPLYINETNHNLIQSEIVNLKDKKEREKYFSGVIKSSNNQVYSFSYGMEDGEYYGARRNIKNEIEIIENNSETNGKSRYYSVTNDLTSGKLVDETEKFDPRTRDWYKSAKEKQKPVFSPIYKHFVMDDLAISAAYPIYNKNGILQGVLGTHIIFSGINNHLREIAKNKNADIYILERSTGQLVANSLKQPNFKNLGNNKTKRINIEEIDNKPITESYANYKKNLKNYFLINTKNDKFHVTFTDYKKEGIDWIIITSIPESQFTAVMSKNINAFVLLSIIILVLSILIYIKSTGNVLKPIYNLIDATEKFSKGDFSYRAKVYKNDEIGRLSSSFNNMAEQLYMLINKLEEKVEERTIELEKTNIILKDKERSIRLLLNSTAEAIYGIDINGNCTFCNASCLRILGYENEEKLIGKNMHLLLRAKNLDETISNVDECKVFNEFNKGECIHVDDEVFWRSNGTSFPVEYYSYPQYSNGKIIGAVITFMDITKRKKSEEDIIYLSYHDQLTGLYNRRYFDEELNRINNESSIPLSIAMADMNGLKLVNDSFGHAVGDKLIKKVAEIMKKGCRDKDVAIRLGGDEFVILMPNTEMHEAENIINGINDMALKEKVESVDISISFGYATRKSTKESIDEILKIAEDSMYKKKLFESPSMRSKTINTIISTLHEKNKTEQEHSYRVSELCKQLGEAIGMSKVDIEELKTAGLLHDIGKIAIGECILNKKGKLTDEEWEQVKKHSEVGYRILSTVNHMSEMAEYVLYHHERWDGGGYPKGIMKEAIPLQSRIIAIADSYDAMISERAYRKPLSEEATIDELRSNAGTQFDPELVNVFIEKVLGKSFK
ncbi:HD domain-containing phosphohydrolase [Clostridium drakei]|uniref:HDIG domain-containing protein n=1 Tax=Clostridium drakei TaxID=332101 RepID=A0A2U8DS68_9CLOT|nr:HD domain-containing phosphohydrolase [Clostridium drakei]AWI05606.1 HDIG domain-containing protein [Clostridium drakei]